MKGFIRIGGASFLGILLILGAFIMAKNNGPAPEVVATVVAAPERTTIETKDENENGIADWKEELGTFETIQTPPPSNDTETPEPYVEPTTFTGKFSVAFLQDYLQGKSRGEDFSDPSAFVKRAANTIEQNTQSKKYTRLDFAIVETSEETLRTYGNKLGAALEYNKPPEGTDEDIFILRRALERKDPEILNELIPIENAYANIIADMLEMEVPTEVASQHLELLNRAESMRTHVASMRIIFDDPLFTLGTISTYLEDSEEIIQTIRSLTKTFTKFGIVYARDELGAQLYLFDI